MEVHKGPAEMPALRFGFGEHNTWRGVRYTDIFADDLDRLSSFLFMAEETDRFGVNFMGCCLMTNHVHRIAVAEREESLALAIGDAHPRTGRSVGEDRFVLRFKTFAGRALRAKKS